MRTYYFVKFAKFFVAVFFPFVDDQQVASGGSKACALNFTEFHFNNTSADLNNIKSTDYILSVVFYNNCAFDIYYNKFSKNNEKP